ncbi:uncharacterized protein ASCRUDRAFT_76571 [Ascoidea rubescens DSM 1968]|uniref:Uncharacterized protein n=1 Tax=Ascoidea rubescens DSM 1968 TaxID=1344418 RepID=A0A1D2VEZ8_9ASCO|nr:hypothetical protein ASCRUDRAFT_76571 [Ascoidea rubescens DSM 1968]ODV60047.1 hypothetical protein ASCRUDRAFT_76571 [Ascoidea rubescens DSM 1968]
MPNEILTLDKEWVLDGEQDRNGFWFVKRRQFMLRREMLLFAARLSHRGNRS